MEPFIGQIIMFGGNFAPRGWALCDGQLMSIAQNSALFSVLGTSYGGDGRTTFGLPDLRGRVVVHAGTGPGLSNYQLGDRAGAESVAGKAIAARGTDTTVVAGPVDNRQPYGVVNYIIALDGLYPSRS